MLAVALIILPIFLLISLGSLFARRGGFDAAFWAGTERLTYYALFPALIAGTLARAELVLGEVLPMAIAIDAAILIMVLVALAVFRLAGLTGPELGSFVQGVVRMNTYIGLAVAFGMFGADGVAKAAIAMAAIVPLVNVVCVTVLLFWGMPPEGAPRPPILGALATNPLIVACAVGLGLNVSGIGLPPVLGPMLEILGRAALALGLLAVGAALDLESARRSSGLVALSGALKLLVLPALTAACGALLGVRGTALGIAVLFNGLPTATTAYVLSRQLGGDHRLMAAMITGQTALSAISIPVVLGLLG